MSEGPTRRRTGATLADVWPPAPGSTQAAQPDASGIGAGRRQVAPAGPVTQVSALRESAPPSRPAAAERTIAPRDQRISTETMEGKLLGHGMARYRFQPTETLSYYARLLTSGGVVTLWGRGIAQAIARSKTNVRIGDRVAFRRLDQDPQTGRVQWRAEKPEWFAAQDKAARRRRDEQLAARQAAQEDPDLARAMLPMKAAQALAGRRLADPMQRLKFIASVAARVKQAAQQGHPAPAPTLRTKPKDRSPSETRQKPRRDPDRTR
ncbi:MAG: hypothetical protein SXG53_18825 [Pseudomonadota bacterium]|nr:hypothetical protein [Pseudomonadota bacterium]